MSAPALSRLVAGMALAALLAFALTAPLSVALATLAVAALGALALLRQLPAGSRSLTLPPRSVAIALVLFVGTHALATALAAPFPVHWAKWRGEMFLKLLLVVVPLVAGDRPRSVERALKLLVLVGAAVAAYGIYQHFTGHDFWRKEHTFDTGRGFFAVGFFGHHLTYGGHVMVLWVIAAAWTLFASGPRPSSGAPRIAGERVLAATAWALLSLGLLWSYARSAQLGAAVCAVALVALLPRGRLPLLAVLAALIVFAALSPSLSARFAALGEPGRELTRINLWHSALRGLAARPWLGFGEGNFQEMMRAWGVPAQYDSVSHTHNDFLMHAVNAGVPGLLAALALLTTTTLALWRGRARAGALAWIPLAGVLAQVAISVAGMFQVYQTDNEVEMVLYFLLGCGLACSAGRPTVDRQPG